LPAQTADLALAASDGIAAEAGDACQAADRPTALAAGEKTDEQPALSFVESRQEAIDVAMDACGPAPRVLLALRTATPMHGSAWENGRHGDVLPGEAGAPFQQTVDARFTPKGSNYS
jgi:hypothetical protein